MADGSAETAALLDRLVRYKGVRAVLRTRAADLAAATAGPVLPMRFRKGAAALELFTAIATLGTPQDITLQELRIESFFPMDADTARVLRRGPGRSGRVPDKAGRVLDSRRSGNYNHGARAGRVCRPASECPGSSVGRALH
jgi:hypothetical protein